jgi:hypothetical protein
MWRNLRYAQDGVVVSSLAKNEKKRIYMESSGLTATKVHMDEGIGEQALAGPQHTSPAGICMPGFVTSTPRPGPLAGRGSRILPVIGDGEIAEAYVPDGNGKLGAIGEPYTGSEIVVKGRWPVGGGVECETAGGLGKGGVGDGGSEGDRGRGGTAASLF